MKRIYRLAALALLPALGSATAFAQGAWVKPMPTPTALTTADSVYIYNVGQQKMVYQGEAWTTQILVSDAGAIQWKVMEITNANRQAQYRITTNADGYGGFKSDRGKTQTSSGKTTKYFFWYGAKADSKGGPHALFGNGWTFRDDTIHSELNITEVAGKANTYTLALVDSTDAQPEKVIGYTANHGKNGAASDGLYYDVTYTGNEANCEFYFVNKANYLAYKAELDRYMAAMSLQDLIAQATEAGVDVAAEQEVFNNTASTQAELDNAIATLTAKIVQGATWEHPVSLNGKMLINPTPVTAATAKGWKVTGSIGEKPEGVGEFWNQATAKLEQTINQLPSGVYSFGVEALTATTSGSKFFAGTDSVNLKIIPNDVRSAAKAKELLDTDKSYTDSLFFATLDPTDITVGLYHNAATGYNWTIWRTFNLKFYGSSLDSYQKFAVASVGGENWADQLGQDEFSIHYFDAVNAAIEEAKTATTPEAAVAAGKKAKAALADLKTNVQLLKDFKQLIDVLDQRNIDKYDGALDDVLEEARTMAEALEATNEEIQAMMTKLKAAEQKAIEEVVAPGTDITTAVIKNPTFSASTTGFETKDDGTYYSANRNSWQMTGGQNGQDGMIAGGTSGVAEVWGSNGFNIWQKIKVRKGAFTLKIKNYYRTSEEPDYNAGYRAYVLNNDSNIVRAKVYAGIYASKFVNTFANGFTEAEKNATSHADGWTKVSYNGQETWVPNNVASAKAAFLSDKGDNYYTTVKFISTGDSLNLGMRADSVLGGSWALWDNFELTYEGNDLAQLREALNNAVANNSALADKTMNAEVKNALTAALAAAQSPADADAAFAAAESLASSVSAAEVSIAKYAELKAAYDRLVTALTDFTGATEDAKQKAALLKDQVQDALDAGSIADADVAAKIEEIKAAIAALRRPNTDNATMANPVEMTSMIINPRFTEDGRNVTQNHATGWTFTGANQNNFLQNNSVEIWNKNAEIYQVITGLPQGLYQVLCQGFYRYGTHTKDTTAYNADTLKVNAYLFANGDSVALQKYILLPADATNKAIAQSSPQMSQGWESFINKANGETYFLPADREQAQSRFQSLKNVNSTDLNHDGQAEDPAYLNSLYCYVGADGALRLGIFNHNFVEDDWAPVTNFQLFYFGDRDDTKEIATTTGIEELGSEAKVQAIYTIDGRQVNSLQKGVNVVKYTDKNGKTVVKKVVKK